MEKPSFLDLVLDPKIPYMNEPLSQPIGGNLLPPVQLTPEQESLCIRLDKWYARYDLKVKPSDMFRGAIFSIRSECRNNPDWVAQTAHSLRDIIYPFGSKGNDLPNKEKALKEYGSVRTDEVFTQEVGRIFGSLTELAHHGSGRGSSIDPDTFIVEDFEKLISDFERIMLDVLTRQLDVHNEIDEILKENPKT